jgi:hypothetical protein
LRSSDSSDGWTAARPPHCWTRPRCPEDLSVLDFLVAWWCWARAGKKVPAVAGAAIGR